MPAIPPSPNGASANDKAFARWLIDRGEANMAQHIHLYRQYHTLLVLDTDKLASAGITEEGLSRFWTLYKEFDAPRHEARKRSRERVKDNQARIAAKDVPVEELKKRIFPKRKVPKGIAG